MIKNVIFDMGQVLIKFDEAFFIDRVGIEDPEDRKLLKREVYDSLEWAQMDRGTITDEEGLERMKKRLPERLHDAAKKLTVEWVRPILPIPGVEKLVRELKANGYGIYLLSNASHMQKEYWPRIPGSELFDGRVVSAEEGFVKPQFEIYRILLDRYGLLPEECVFIDDAKNNCEGAFCCGIRPIVFHQDVGEVREKLREMGVNVNP